MTHFHPPKTMAISSYFKKFEKKMKQKIDFGDSY